MTDIKLHRSEMAAKGLCLFCEVLRLAIIEPRKCQEIYPSDDNSCHPPISDKKKAGQTRKEKDQPGGHESIFTFASMSLEVKMAAWQDILFLDHWKPLEFLLASANYEAADAFKRKMLGQAQVWM